MHRHVFHSIKKYERLGYDVTGGEDIVSAAKGICDTSIANIEPNRSSEKKKKKSLPEYQIGLNFGGLLR
ncbi:14653_t:CDS:2, partial [Entrophospora sp. SA101]